MNADKLNSIQPVFGSWYIESKISEGRSSKFYKVYETDGIEKRYAGLKIVKFPSSEQELSRVIASGKYNNVDEYLDELQSNVNANMGIMRSLSYHKNIVRVHNFTIIREASCFYLLSLMELLTPMNEYLSFETVSKNDAITVGKDICRAMQAFRDKGIIHHNVSPDNIYVDASGNYKLGNFGGYDYNTAMSEASVFMAPELYDKESLNEISSDIYSLGMLLYKLLNNNRQPFLPPYPAPVSLSDREQSFAKCMRGEAFPTPVNADYKLGAIISKATSFSPEARYISPMAMLSQLESYTPYTNTVSPSASAYPQKSKFEVNSNDIHFGSFEYPAETKTDDYYDEDTTDTYDDEDDDEPQKKRWYFLVLALVIVLALVVALIVKSGSDGKDKTTTEASTTTQPTTQYTTEPTTEETTTEESTTEETTTEETTTEETTTEETTTETTTEETTTETTTESTTEETTTEEETEPYTEPTLVTTSRKNGDKSEDGKTYMKISSFNVEEIPDDEFFDKVLLSIDDNLGENITSSNVYIYQMYGEDLIQRVTANMTAEVSEDFGGDVLCTITVDDGDFYYEPDNYQYFLCFEEGAIVSDTVITLPLQVRIETKY